MLDEWGGGGGPVGRGRMAGDSEFQKRTGIRTRSILPPERKFGLRDLHLVFRRFQEIITSGAATRAHPRGNRAAAERSVPGSSTSPTTESASRRQGCGAQVAGLLGCRSGRCVRGDVIFFPRVSGVPVREPVVAVSIPLPRAGKRMKSSSPTTIRSSDRDAADARSNRHPVVGEGAQRTGSVDSRGACPGKGGPRLQHAGTKNGMEMIRSCRQRYPGRAVMISACIRTNRYAVRRSEGRRVGLPDQESAPDEW